MNKKIYLCNMEWTQTHEEFGGVSGEFVLKEKVSYKDYEKLLKKDLFICDYDLQQENKQLKELINTILNWNIFKNECPMNFGYDKNTIEDKAQEVFCQDDDYCENNCNDDYTKCCILKECMN